MTRRIRIQIASRRSPISQQLTHVRVQRGLEDFECRSRDFGLWNDQAVRFGYLKFLCVDEQHVCAGRGDFAHQRSEMRTFRLYGENHDLVGRVERRVGERKRRWPFEAPRFRFCLALQLHPPPGPFSDVTHARPFPELWYEEAVARRVLAGMPSVDGVVVARFGKPNRMSGKQSEQRDPAPVFLHGEAARPAQ